MDAESGSQHTIRRGCLDPVAYCKWVGTEIILVKSGGLLFLRGRLLASGIS